MSILELKKEPHWSYSALQCYLTCPMKYKFRYVDNAPVERTCSALPFGRAFHATLSERARIGMDLKLSDTKDIFAFGKVLQGDGYIVVGVDLDEFHLRMAL